LRFGYGIDSRKQRKPMLASFQEPPRPTDLHHRPRFFALLARA
jgi:hypothetical protein